jgi:DICT domain-containing protein
VTRADLTIGDLVARTGVGEATLRVWERRHGFPAPERLPSGHRRYSPADAELVLQVVRERAAGLSLAAAIARARDAAEGTDGSVFAGLRRQRPDVQPVRLRKPILLALSRAIEDESCARAERALLFGAFQRERFYRQSERRWRELSRTADLAIVFADFPRRRRRAGAPEELPLDRSAGLNREWSIVCEAPGHAVCLAGIELPAAQRPREAAREFEVIWSVEPAVVRTAVEICLALARGVDERVVERVPSPVPQAVPPPEAQLRLATAITARALGALS